MTPNEYQSDVIPLIKDIIKNGCICKNSALRTIIAFDYRKYKISPVGLADAEILIQYLLRNNSGTYSKNLNSKGNWDYTCLRCGCILHEQYEEYSINMSRSLIENDGNVIQNAPYLIGWFGFNADEFNKINGFLKVDKTDNYIQIIKSSAQQSDASETMT